MQRGHCEEVPSELSGTYLALWPGVDDSLTPVLSETLLYLLDS